MPLSMVGVSSIFFKVAQQAVGQDQGAQPLHTAQINTAAHMHHTTRQAVLSAIGLYKHSDV
jgi:hypothetical protein